MCATGPGDIRVRSRWPRSAPLVVWGGVGSSGGTDITYDCSLLRSRWYHLLIKREKNAVFNFQWAP